MTIRVMDIGGSGVKTAKISDISQVHGLTSIEAEHLKVPDWDDFSGWVHREGLLDAQAIGISCAGFIEGGRRVKLFKVGGWRDKRLVHELEAHSPESTVFLLNDAEAHLMAHVDLFQNPVMCISLGTSIGFALSDCNGEVFRPPDGMNFDIGELSIDTRAREKQVWWALGSHGLDELITEKGPQRGVERFGYRLGGFLAQICGLFRPKTVVLSGGITDAWWDSFSGPLLEEFDNRKPVWLTTPGILKSPFSRHAALIGIAKYAVAQVK